MVQFGWKAGPEQYAPTPLLDYAIDTFIFHSAGPDQQAFVQSYGRDVLSKLRTQIRGRVAAHA